MRFPISTRMSSGSRGSDGSCPSPCGPEHGYVKSDLEKEHPRVAEIPFGLSERKCMTTFHRWPGGYMAFTKGGVDVMLEKAVNALADAALRRSMPP